MKTVTLLTLIAIAPALAFAELAPEPAVVPVEFGASTVEVKPGLRAGIASNNNFFTEPAGLENSAEIFTLNPHVTARLGDDSEYSELQAEVAAGLVSGSSDDNFLDYAATYAGQYLLAANLQLSAVLGTRQQHEERGTGSTDNCLVGPLVPPLLACPAEPAVFQDVNASVAAMLGSPESRGRATLGINALGRRYTNNGLLTGGLEYDQFGAQFRFAWQLSGKTSAVLEMTRVKFDYLLGGDSTDMEYLAGAEWDVTGKTSGYALVGMQEKDFENPLRTDLSDPAYRVGVNWLPTEHSFINLELARRFDESNVFGTTAKESTSWRVRATHQLNDRVEPYVRLGMENIDYAGLPRSDEAKTFGLGVDYKFRRWAVLGAGWSRTQEESNVGAGALDNDTDVFAITADLTL